MDLSGTTATIYRIGAPTHRERLRLNRLASPGLRHVIDDPRYRRVAEEFPIELHGVPPEGALWHHAIGAVDVTSGTALTVSAHVYPMVERVVMSGFTLETWFPAKTGIISTPSWSVRCYHSLRSSIEEGEKVYVTVEEGRNVYTGRGTVLRASDKVVVQGEGTLCYGSV